MSAFSCRTANAGIEIAAALAELKFADKSIVPFLVGRLDAKKNKLWYSDVKLLRHLTDQKFGPESPYAGEKERDAELLKWREWWQQQPGAQPRAVVVLRFTLPDKKRARVSNAKRCTVFSPWEGL